VVLHFVFPLFLLRSWLPEPNLFFSFLEIVTLFAPGLASWWSHLGGLVETPLFSSRTLLFFLFASVPANQRFLLAMLISSLFGV